MSEACVGRARHVLPRVSRGVTGHPAAVARTLRPLRGAPRRLGRFRRLLLCAVAALAAVAPGVVSAEQLTLAWVDNSNGQAGFEIERTTGTTGTYVEIAREPPGVTSHTDSSVVGGTSYCYRVRAYNAAGASPYSKEACGSVAASLHLTVALTGMGGGAVSSSPTGISCGTACFESYPSGTLVTLTATAKAGSMFAGWSGGGCSGTGSCTLTGNAPVTVMATFTPVPPTRYALTVTRSGPGRVTSSPAGISCGADCREAYPSGTVVTLTATPPNGARFVGWQGVGCSGTDPCTVTVTANTSVSATFVRRIRQ